MSFCFYSQQAHVYQRKNENEEEDSSKPKDPVEVVFTIDAGKAKMVEVKTGISDDTFIQIVEGLENEQEIVSGPYRAISKELEDDVKVSVSKKRGSKRNAQ